MSYRIEWLPEALSQFTEDWELLDRESQRLAMDALEGMDRMLLQWPMSSSESRETPSRRILFHPPLIIKFRVDHHLQIVTIYKAEIQQSRE